MSEDNEVYELPYDYVTIGQDYSTMTSYSTYQIIYYWRRDCSSPVRTEYIYYETDRFVPN